MIKAAIAVTSISAVVIFGVVGCGSDDDKSSTSGSTETTTTEKSGDAMKDEKSDDAMKDDKSGEAMEKSTPANAAAMSKKTQAQIKVVDTRYGKILTDGTGRALYLFTREKSDSSDCYDECAKAWPPLFTKGKPKAKSGADQDLLGTTERRDGSTQVTYDGQPLYYYVDEDEAGEVLCQGVDEFGGIWYVVAPNGKAITKS